MIFLLATVLAQSPAPEELPILQGPKVIEYVEAPWPEGAIAEGREAVVTVRITLDAEGEVGNLEVTGSGGAAFDEAAVDAILAMRFSPAQTEAGPVPVVFDFEYGFRLEAPPVEDVPAPVNLEGRLREMGTRNALAGITVVVDGSEITGTTDADGRFALRGVPLGTVLVRLFDPDHETLERSVEVVEGEVTGLDLWMRATTYRDDELVGLYERKKEEVTRRTISIEEVRRIPGTFGDPIKVIQTLPGAARSPFGTGLLVIRGSDPEDSAVYVDGIRLPLLYHLTGTTSVLSPEIIESVDYLPGGYGVQYGRSTGGVIDVKTKDAFSEQGKLVWGTDILDSQVFFEGRLKTKAQKKNGSDGHQLAIGARRSYIDAFIPLFTRETGFNVKPRYWDYQAKYIAPMPDGHRFTAFVYGFNDLLTISTPDDFSQGTDQDTQGDLKTTYSSHRVVFHYENRISDDLTWTVTPSIGLDGIFLGLGSDFSIGNDQILGNVRTEFRYRAGERLELVPGMDLAAGSYSFDFRSAIAFEDIDDPLAEREPVGFGGKGGFLSPDLYLKANIRPLGDDRVLITPGVRAQMYRLSQKTPEGTEGLSVFNQSIDPRILGRFEITKGNTFKISTGWFSQPPQPQEAISADRTTSVGYERVRASSIGFEQQLGQAIKWDIDLFYKDFDNLVVFNPAFNGEPGVDAYINNGNGRAYGLEIIARHEPVGRFFGWVSYTLSRSERQDRAGGTTYLFDFDQTHIFSAQAGYDLPFDLGVSAQVQYVTGNPNSPFNAGIYDADTDRYNGFRIGPRNSERLPDFFQSSFRVDKLWTFKRWQLETYVDLLNAVRGVNPEFRLYNYDNSESAFVRGLPFIPNLGLEAKIWL